MARPSRKTIEDIETADLKPNRDYYAPSLNRSISADSAESAAKQVEAIKAKRRAQEQARLAEAAKAEGQAE